MVITIGALMATTAGVAFCVGWFGAKFRKRKVGDRPPLVLTSEQHMLIADALASLDDARELAAVGSLERVWLDLAHDTVATLTDGLGAAEVPLW